MKKIILFDIDETLATCPGNNEASSVMFKKVFNIDACEDLIPIKIRAGKTQKCIIEEILRQVRGLNPNVEVKIPDTVFEVWGEAQSETLKKILL